MTPRHDDDHDHLDLAELERQARAIDDLQLAGDVDSMARAAVKRQILLEQLDEAGLLSGAAAASARRELDRELHERLLGYVRAGERRREYVESAQRARVLGSAPAAVSVDWFRLPSPVPGGVDPLAWTAHWEEALGGSPIGDAQVGSVLVHDETGWHRLEWRVERGRPAIVGVEPFE